MGADGARSLGICEAAARREVDGDRGRREAFVDGRLLEYLDGPALALSAALRAWQVAVLSVLVLDRYFVCSEPDTRLMLSAVARNVKESRRIAR